MDYNLITQDHKFTMAAEAAVMVEAVLVLVVKVAVLMNMEQDKLTLEVVVVHQETNKLEMVEVDQVLYF